MGGRKIRYLNMIMRLIVSILFALNGIAVCLGKERNFIIQTAIAFAGVAAGFYFQISFTEWGILLLCFSMVLCLEMVNSAIEQICNFMHKDHHPAIGKIKDISAGAVLVASIFSSIIGCIIFIPKLFT